MQAVAEHEKPETAESKVQIVNDVFDNMFTFLQNWIMKKAVSDAKIRAELEQNMKKPVKVSGFQQRLQDMAKQRQQQQGGNKKIK